MDDGPLVRPGTWDAAIHRSTRVEYATLPERFAPGEVVVDVGCHTGGFCTVAAERGATVVGYEANRENHALAAINTARLPSVAVRFGAVWRSDTPGSGERWFTPAPDPANTGGGSVLFDTEHDHRATWPSDGPVGAARGLVAHAVPTIALDAVLEATGPVRFLKLDAEGAEFPILLTSRRLDLVAEIAGEYHQLDAVEMTRLAPAARVGEEPYRADLLRRTLEAAGFTVRLRAGPDPRRGLFAATRAPVTAGR